MYKHILITGGAGFVGANLGLLLKRDYPQLQITALDNLKRRGSELNLPRLRQHGIAFIHGDIRNREDLESAGEPGLILECSAEPSVLAGYGGSPEYVLHTNLTGAINCFELARRRGSGVIFLSTSRVYPMQPINSLAYRETAARFELEERQSIPGASALGINESFPLEGARSLYGASKLCAELLLLEYIDAYGMRGVINRCGVLTGPWQMGKVDQGVIVHWVARHIFGGELAYFGYGGHGKQVRDILHVEDLYRLLLTQMADMAAHSGKTYNVGGGRECSLSLCELTALCREFTGAALNIKPAPQNRQADIPYYISDCARVRGATGWQPRHTPGAIVEEIARWITDHRDSLRAVLG